MSVVESRDLFFFFLINLIYYGGRPYLKTNNNSEIVIEFKCGHDFEFLKFEIMKTSNEIHVIDKSWPVCGTRFLFSGDLNAHLSLWSSNYPRTYKTQICPYAILGPIQSEIILSVKLS